MAVTGQNMVTLLDAEKLRGSDGQLLEVVDLMARTNNSLLDAVMVEANSKHTHQFAIETGYPSSTWVKLYQGVQPNKGERAQVTETMGRLEQYSVLDERMASQYGEEDVKELRLQEAKSSIKGMNQDAAKTLFYGNSKVNPEQFDGLSMRYATHSDDDEDKSSYYVIDAGGTGANLTSLWFVTWGSDATFLLYPEGSVGGIERKDLGEVSSNTADGGEIIYLKERFSRNIGLGVKNFKNNVRIANIDLTDATLADRIFDLMIEAESRLKDPAEFDENKVDRTVIYCNSRVRSFLTKAASNKPNVQLSADMVAGKKVVDFFGIPLRREDALLNTETEVPAAQ